jgi:serine O-acetyltransferase
MSPERLWRLSIALQRAGHRRLAATVKNLNSVIYHNALATDATVNRSVYLGHHALGTVIHNNVVIGERVKIWQNVTLAVRAPAGSPHHIVIEDDVVIGANAVVITPLKQSLRIGRGARVGAGAVVTHDVPAGATVVGVPAAVKKMRGDRCDAWSTNLAEQRHEPTRASGRAAAADRVRPGPGSARPGPRGLRAGLIENPDLIGGGVRPGPSGA